MVNKLFRKTMAASMAAIMAVGMLGCGAKDNAENSAAENKNTPVPTEAAAGNEGTSGTTDPAPTEEPEAEGAYKLRTDENGNVYDLGGMEVIIRDWWSTGEEGEPNNAFDEARLEYLDWIQETYNFTIKMQGISDWAGTPEDFVNYATSGGDENYVFTVWQGESLVAAMNSGLMYDLSTLDCLDFSEDKWKTGIHELMTGKNGEIYGMNASTPEPRVGIYFNKRILEEAGYNPDDLYTWQENGEWTWEKFAEVCAKVQRDLDNDGIVDIYGETSQRAQIYTAAVVSNGGEFIGKENGVYVNELETNKTLEALNWSMDLIINYELPVPADAAWDYYVSAFKEGRAAFCADDAYRFNDFQSMEDDWGFVCFPKGPNATDNDYTNVLVDNVLTIPACYDADKAWKIAFAYDLYTEPVPGFEDYEGWKSGYLNKARDTECVDLTLARMIENGMITYHNMIPGIALGNDILWTLGYADENGEVATPAQRAEALRASWGAYIDDANK